MAFRPGSQQLASVNPLATSRQSTDPAHIQVWDYRRGVQTMPSWESAELASVLFFDPQKGRRLFVGNLHGLEIRDPDTLAKVQPSLELNSRPTCWAFCADGGLLAVGCEDGTTHVWDLKRGMRSFLPFRQTSEVHSVSFSPDGAYLLATSEDGTAKVWDLAVTSEALLDWSPEERLTGWALSQDGNTLAAVWPDRTVNVIDLATFRERMPRQPIPRDESNAGLDPLVTVDATGQRWAAAIKQSSVFGIWSAEGTAVRHLELRHPTPIEHLQISASGENLITLDSEESIVRLWDTRDGRLVHETNLLEPNWLKLALDQTGRRIAICFRPPVNQLAPGKPSWGFMIYDLELGRPVGETQWFHMPPQCVEFSPDGRQLAMSESWGHILDAETGKILQSFKHGGTTTQIRWHPDGKTVLTTGGSPSAIKVWSATDGNPWYSSEASQQPLLAPLSMSPSGRVEASFSPDGRFIIASDDNHATRVWDAATAEPLTPVLQHNGPVRWACVTPGNRLITASGLNLLRAWDLKPTLLPAEAITDYVKLLSARRLSASGLMSGIPGPELAELHRSLLARHPELFEPKP